MDKHKMLQLEVRKDLAYRECQHVLAVYSEAKDYLTNCRSFEEVAEGLHKFSLEMFTKMQLYAKKPIKNLKINLLLTDE